MAMRLRRPELIPHALTGLRAASAPLLWWLITGLELRAAFLCLALAMLSDAVDGALMRRIGRPSTAGAYFDASADCAVILAAFAAFAWLGIYPAWVVGLIVTVFMVFVGTAPLLPTIYDPVGRQIGGILFAAAAGTLLLPDFFLHALILALVTGALATTLAVRLAHTFWRPLIRPV